MIEFNSKHRQLFGEKFLDLGHIATGALVFGQFISSESLNWFLIFIGLAILLACYLTSYLFLKGDEE